MFCENRYNIPSKTIIPELSVIFCNKFSEISLILLSSTAFFTNFAMHIVCRSPTGARGRDAYIMKSVYSAYS